MAGFRLTIEDGKFRDAHGRQVILRGINVAGDAKYPNQPDQPSHIPDNFFDGDNVKFTGKPFPKDEAHLHFSRLKRCGYNTIRYVFTWEAIEAAGPGIYDEEWIQHTIDVLRAAKEYGFYVFMDPHQDVWSRFSGGSGAPMWTLYAAGLNPQSFAATEAAIVHNTYPEPDGFPKMIWSTNYFRLAAATMFTLFFAGRVFAPKCIIDQVNIQDYLQDHFFNACAHLARRIHDAGGIEDEAVFGWESLNEPNKGMVGYHDISVIPKEQALKKGSCPTIWQTILTGSGRAVEVDTWDMGGLGPYKVGRSLIDPHGEIAWLPAGYDESRYSYVRDPGWKLGECIWAQHGVWDPSSDTLLKKDYFGKHPVTGDVINYTYFADKYFMDFFRKYRDTVRTHHKDAIILLQGPTMELPPDIKGTPDGDDPLLVYAPHWYDGITLMTKKWNRTFNVDVLGVLRGRYWHPSLAIRIGETAIRNCFRDQHAAMRKEGLEYLGNHPCVMTEFGIPYDMDDQHAYKTGDYTSQSAAMDANHYGVESAGLEGYTLWLYMAKNDHDRGDQWNGEDLSIFSIDDKLLPVSPIPSTPDLNQSTSSLLRPPATASSSQKKELDNDGNVTPVNIKRTLTNPSISSEAASRQPELTASPGYRAAEAYVRAAPIAAAGLIKNYVFDLTRCQFSMTIQAPKVAATESPTVIFLPDYHFTKDACSVEASSGKWEISSDEEETALIQRLRWWHGEGEQTIKITGLVRKYNGSQASDDPGYYEQCNRGTWSSCTIM
ncbi:glycoside hydrolase family 5 protein [Lasiosphaeria miniovina]|uniref:Glycoside hydrolase family 5 protein n=1 Tax=Lasiosphaeria miniovina TaxID=1954250 RepID=A0AA40DRK5_9PEZI|nr:glycoside hydrolase family 5 protein [Lasiosphaeria miniovina]KAK0712970.1 glycoside hydrolase family 5 protein [Lasiosphaeria miniovina]